MAAAVSNVVKNVVAGSKPRFALFLKYAKVELTPPSPRDFGEIKEGISNLISSYRSGRWKQLTVKEATLNTLVGVEILCWFYVGEVIGKRSLVGYDIHLA